jgi:Family of unknown function (DUF6527)
VALPLWTVVQQSGDPVTHRHAHLDPDEPNTCVEIDEHVCLSPTHHSLAPAGIVINSPEGEAYGYHHAGFIVAHDRAGFDVRCEGFITTDDCERYAGRPRWSMTGSLEGGDLTLSPSILCTLGSVAGQPCGFHGFIRDGKWVPA